MNTMRLVTAAVILLVLIFGSCNSDDVTPLTAEEQVTELLVGTGTGKTWNIQSVTVDGVDKSSLFTGMTIRFAAGSLTVTNGGPVWPGSGIWTFTTAEATSIELADGTEILVNVTETTLTLTLNWTRNTFGPGRTQSISGTHVFSFG